MTGKGPLLIIDNSDSFTRNLAQLAEEEGATGIEVVREDVLDPAEAGRFRKILISPGPGLPQEFPRMLEVIRRFAGQRSILGICLGHQAIATAFGGKLIRLEQVRHGIAQEVRILDPHDPLFTGLPEKITAGLYHSWAVDPAGLPPKLRVTAVSGDGVVMSCRHVQHPLRGVQFHPESIMTPWGRRLITNWLEAAE